MQQHRRPDPDRRPVHGDHQHFRRCRNRAQKAESRAVHTGRGIGEKVVEVIAGAKALPGAAE
jgi:hypothetical protein